MAKAWRRLSTRCAAADIRFGRLADLSRTGSFRQALLFLGLFGAGSVLVFGFLYLQTHRFVTRSIDDWLLREAQQAFAMPVDEVQHVFDARLRTQIAIGHVFTVYSAGHLAIAGDKVPWPRGMDTAGQPFNFSLRMEPGHRRYRGIAQGIADGRTILIAQDMYQTREFDEAFINTAIWGGVLTMALALVGAAIVGAGTVKRLDGVARAIQAIVQGDLTKRLPLHGTSADLDRLAFVVNDMLDEIERLMQEVKGVTDAIAHDLRTPLTRILAGLERAQRRSATPPDYEAAIEAAIQDVRSVLMTFMALLRISELEDGVRRGQFSDVDLGAIARDAVELYEPVADEKSITLVCRATPPRPGAFQGDASLLFDALSNLIDNAIKFTPARGRIEVAVQAGPGLVEVSVTDTGSGISAEDKAKVAKRFFRSEQSRHTPGNGLGLALVAAVARLHGMELLLEDAHPGTRAVLRLAADAVKD